MCAAAAGALARRRALLCALIAAATAAVASAPTPCVAANLACAHGGACMFDNDVGNYCACASGYAGALCDQLVSPGMACTLNGSLVAYCMNGGLCPSANVSTSYCDCSTIAPDVAGNTFRCVAAASRDRARVLTPRPAAARTASSPPCSAPARPTRA